MSDSSSDISGDPFRELIDKIEDAIGVYATACDEPEDLNSLTLWLAKSKAALKKRALVQKSALESGLVSPPSESLEHQQPNGIIIHQQGQEDSGTELMMSVLDENIKADEEHGTMFMSVFDNEIFVDNGPEDLVDDHAESSLHSVDLEEHSVDADRQFDTNRIELQRMLIKYENIMKLESVVASAYDGNKSPTEAMRRMYDIVQWSKKQRRRKRDGELTEAQVEDLDSLVSRGLWSWEASEPAKKSHGSFQHRMLQDSVGTIGQVLENTASYSPKPSRASLARSPQLLQAVAAKKAAAAAKKIRKAAASSRKPKNVNADWNRLYNLVKAHCPLNEEGETWDLPWDFEVTVKGNQIPLGTWLNVQRQEMPRYATESPNWYNKLADLFPLGWSTEPTEIPETLGETVTSGPMLEDSDADDSTAGGDTPTHPMSIASSDSAPSGSSSIPPARLSASLQIKDTGGSVLASTAPSPGRAPKSRLSDQSRGPSKSPRELSNEVWRAPSSAAETLPSVFASSAQRSHPAPSPVSANSKSPGSEVGISKRKVSSPSDSGAHKKARHDHDPPPPSPIVKKVEPQTIDLSQQSHSDTECSSSSSTSSGSSYTSSSRSSSGSVKSMDSGGGSYSLKDKALFKSRSAANSVNSVNSGGVVTSTAHTAMRSSHIIKTEKTSSKVEAEATAVVHRNSSKNHLVTSRTPTPTPAATLGTQKAHADHTHSAHRPNNIALSAAAPAPRAVSPKLEASTPKRAKDPRTIKTSPHSPDLRPPNHHTTSISAIKSLTPPPSRSGGAAAFAPHTNTATTATSSSIAAGAMNAVSRVEITPLAQREPLYAEGLYVGVVYTSSEAISALDAGLDDTRFALAKQLDDPHSMADGEQARFIRLLPEHPSDLVNTRYKYLHNEAKIWSADPENFLIKDMRFIIDEPGAAFPLTLCPQSKCQLMNFSNNVIDVQTIVYESE